MDVISRFLQDLRRGLEPVVRVNRNSTSQLLPSHICAPLPAPIRPEGFREFSAKDCAPLMCSGTPDWQQVKPPARSLSGSGDRGPYELKQRCRSLDAHHRNLVLLALLTEVRPLAAEGSMVVDPPPDGKGGEEDVADDCEDAEGADLSRTSDMGPGGRRRSHEGDGSAGAARYCPDDCVLMGPKGAD